MKSLFLRIFLWFWLAMVAITFVLVLTSPFFTRSRPGVERWQQGSEDFARERVDRLAGWLERAGPATLPPRRGEGRGRHHVDLFVIDAAGREIMGREAPEPVREIARRVISTGLEASERRGGLHLVARSVRDPRGRQLAVVAGLRRPPRPIDLLEPQALWWRMAVLALLVGGLSFGLARHLSSPVGALRRATRRLSEGDLGARVGGRVVRRRDEIGQLARDFDAMAERLEHLIGSQRRLLRDVSHELRSPLARLRVALELARQRAPESTPDQLDRMEMEAGRIDDLIGQLLLLERLTAGEPDRQPQSFDLAGLLGEVAEDGAYEAESAGSEVALAARDDAPMVGHRDLVRSALDNVLRNAIRFAPAGTPVEVDLHHDEGSVTVTVRDRGPGVPAEQLESLFEPFARVGEARDRGSGGTGLGLAITRRAIELHGGTVTARNHPDGGLEVIMTFPVDAVV